MKKLRLVFISALLFSLWQMPTMVSAQNQFNLDALQPGQLILNINATERVEVNQDTLHISLQYITTGQNRVSLQDEVNTVMSEVLEILEGSAGVDYSIEQYQVYMIQSRERDFEEIADQQFWRAQQSVQLNSLDSDAILNLAKELQENNLIIQNMYYSLSTEQYERVADSLLNAALEKLQSRANVTANSLDKASAQLVEVTVNGNGGSNIGYRGRGMVMEMSASDSSSITAPVAQPGKTEVSLTISARALLSP